VADPSECPFDDPSFGQDLETDGIASLHNLQLPCPGAPHDERHLLSRIASVGKDALDEGEQSACPAQQIKCSIAMATPKQQRRRALELLEASIDGTEAIMLAYGFKTELLVELVNAGLATASIERIVAGGRRVEVTRVRITGAGRRALAKLRWP
jgi:hypothetical protein